VAEAHNDNDKDNVDEALEETFPASDPPANTVETGIGVDGGAPADASTPQTRRPDSSTATVRPAPPTR
jgi:hypothetical protein